MHNQFIHFSINKLDYVKSKESNRDLGKIENRSNLQEEEDECVILQKET